MNLLDTFKTEAEALYPQLVAWRRDFHQHPELGFQEVRTAGIVAEHLQNLGLEVSTGIGKTGVVAMVEGDNLPDDAPVVLLRFDMDALPIDEQNPLTFRSQNPGVMHACGHDGHTAIGMGVATLLSQHRQQLQGRVKLVFQPAEEGLGGAQAMLNDGVLENPKPQASYALHLWSRMALNQVVVQSGPLWAGADKVEIIVHGQGGHGAMPHETVDAIVVASQIVVALQSVVARNVSPSDTAVISIGIFQSGNASNVIAERAELIGSIRWFSEETRSLIKRRISELAQGICAGYGATCEVRFPGGIGATINAERETSLIRTVAQQVVGTEQVIEIPPMMVSEDMSLFLERAPGCYIMIGASDPAGPLNSAHHNATFDFDERMLPTGVAILAGAAAHHLANQ